MRVIGTAGHVDHGKSSLVKRLTGIDPDRLAEEKAREMTIDLGFAWLTLPSGETLGIIDVPGHRDFIENMLAGIGGIDAVLLVIAADEGIMPQTREHLAILDLLGVQNGLIVLSKIDLVDDDWLELVEDEIREAVRDTTLADADIVRVSAHTGAGIDTLLIRMTALLTQLPQQIDYRQPRLSIDRVFIVSGFGTVATGTLLGGTLHVGDEIEIQPTGRRGRVRGLQSYKQSVEIAQPGSRVAVNIAGVEKTEIERGYMLTHPRQLQPTLLVDVRFQHLKDASRPLKHNAEAKLFVGASEAGVHVRLLDAHTLSPGVEGWLQLRLEKPLPLAQGDRFILRYPSPGETIGGGVVVNPQPGKRWKRFVPDVISQLETRLLGSPAERLAQAADQPEPIKRNSLQKQLGYSDSELDRAIHEALDEGLVIELLDKAYISARRWQAINDQIVQEVRTFHKAEPLRLGIGREELRSWLGIKQGLFNILIGANSQLVVENNLVRSADHKILLNISQQAAADTLMAQMQTAAYTPPSFAEAVQIAGEPVVRALIERGDIVQVQPDVIFTRTAYDALVSAVLDHLDRNGQVTAAEIRDHFNTSRKYAIGLLEHLDQTGLTLRVGDARIRKPR